MSGPRFVVQIGEKTIDYNEEFRLFLTTRNPAPEIPPDAASVITEVNFTTTKAGLTGQVNILMNSRCEVKYINTLYVILTLLIESGACHPMLNMYPQHLNKNSLSNKNQKLRSAWS